MKIIGHRGARKEQPENTLFGFAHLRSLGINRVELDLFLSKDQELVVFHDSELNRLTQVIGKVSEKTAAELAKIPILHDFKPVPLEQGTIPRLSEVLKSWQALEHIQLEVKSLPAETIPMMLKKLSQAIENFNLKNIAVVTSSDQTFLRAAHQQHPEWTLGWVAEKYQPNLVAHCKHLNAKYLIAFFGLLNSELIQEAHEADLIVSTWTVNDKNKAIELKAMGVDSLITDNPSLMLMLD